MFETKPVSVELKSITGNVSMNVSAYTVNRVTGNMTVIDWNRHKGRWIHLENIDFPRTSSRQVVDVLIGLDCAELHCAIEEVRGRPGEPIARRTLLGGTCIGHPGINYSREISQTNFTYFISDQSKIENLTGSANQLYETGDLSSYTESIPKVIIEDISAVTNRETCNANEYQIYRESISYIENVPSLADDHEMRQGALGRTEKGLTTLQRIGRL